MSSVLVLPVADVLAMLVCFLLGGLECRRDVLHRLDRRLLLEEYGREEGELEEEDESRDGAAE